MVTLVGSLHAQELYNADGAAVYDIYEAVECAEDTYGSDWESVHNEQDGISRDDYLEECDYNCCDEWGDDEPVEGDFTIAPCGRLGGKSALGRHEGKFVGEFDCDEDAAKAARDIMDQEQYWVNIWLVSDHGNWSLYTD
jgi:hypothetical protein